MLFKLSIKNIKKSFKDYSIYFFTLVFAIAMFYMFNSIDAQSTLLSLEKSKYEIIQSLVTIISYVSIFVSIILGFLIVYSNNFLIRKRKKEIGLYEILGMKKRKISLIIFIETIIVGLISLVVGLLVGILLSQLLSIFIAKLFEVNLASLTFVFSKTAFLKTVLYFGIIFLLVIIFNIITLNKYKIIDLIYADKKNENVKIRNKFITLFSFLLSIAFTGYAYYLLIVEKVIMMFDSKLLIMLISGAIGTFLLFFSLSGFLIKIIEKIKKLYYKKLNIFTLKQVNSKINTSVISTTIICLMLLLTISLLSGSMSMGNVFNNDFASNNLTDYTIKADLNITYINDDFSAEVIKNESFANFENLIFQNEYKEFSLASTIIHKYYDKNFVFSNIMNQKEIENIKKEYGSNTSFTHSVPIVRISEFNNFLEMIGKEKININTNEYVIVANIAFLVDAYTPFYEEGKSIVVNGVKLLPGTKEVISMAYENYTSASNDGIILVNDEITNNLDLLNISLVGNFNETVKNDSEINDKFYTYLSNNAGSGFQYMTRESMSASSLGIKAMTIFLGLYLGITFAISSATVLAIGQLSESSDNKKRYKILNQIGADEKTINKALLTQIAITFIFPLVVALIHSYFALKELNRILIALGSIDLTSNILITTIFMLIVYGGYFLITYLASKNIIKKD